VQNEAGRWQKIVTICYRKTAACDWSPGVPSVWPWAVLPTKPEVDKDGRQRRGVDGKPAFAPVMAWCSRRLEDAFSRRVVELVRAAHPADLVPMAA